MKIQIDTDAKTVKLEESANVYDLLNTLKKLFPENEWKNYTLQTNTTIIDWYNPIHINRWNWQPYEITCGTSTYCIETN